jgi:[acyl-carrier-protein] S-malonyltransferase
LETPSASTELRRDEHVVSCNSERASNIFLFPGQGSQEVGMGADLFKTDSFFRALVDRASERTGADLERICLRGPERDLVRTRLLQPLMVCVSLGYLRRLTARGLKPDQVLGHSLGEITALAAAGIVDFETAVDIAAKRGELMDAAAARLKGGMVAVISPEREAIQKFLAGVVPSGKLVLANDNAPNQIVLSGEQEALEQAAQFITRGKLGQCRRLPVAGPWHSPAMAPARREFEAWLGPVEFHPPQVPLLFNVTAAAETDPGKIRQLVARNLVEPVRWRSCLEQLRAAGATALFEIGPGRVLSGLARANGFGDETRVGNVNNLRGVDLAAGKNLTADDAANTDKK